MKKILCIFVCILLLGGCGKGNSKEVENEPADFGGFSCTVRTAVNEIEICADAKYIPYESLTFSFTSPEAVNGMTVNCKSGEYELQVKGLTFTVSGDKLPFSMMCRTLEDCLDKVQGTLPEKDLQTGATVYTYNSGTNICKLYVDSDTGAFKKLTVNGADTLIFENFAFS